MDYPLAKNLAAHSFMALLILKLQSAYALPLRVIFWASSLTSMLP
ncbi:hypothetical protein BVRB_5g097730 [Beta vulgaris subsp. vulgaris]|nr:hypothetical protein BVRB_5g097730 [Beta vulgaris subsp. vulgaris]